MRSDRGRGDDEDLVVVLVAQNAAHQGEHPDRVVQRKLRRLGVDPVEQQRVEGQGKEKAEDSARDHQPDSGHALQQEPDRNPGENRKDQDDVASHVGGGRPGPD